MFSLFSLILYIVIAAIGFMMAYLYKNTTTEKKTFGIPGPGKALRTFLTILLVATLTIYILSYMTTHALFSSAIPDENMIKYRNTKSVMIFLLNVFFLVLIVVANFYSLSPRKFSPVPYLFIAAFYTLFILKDAFYISDYYITWLTAQKILPDEMPDFHTNGWIKCGLGLGVTAFNGVMMWWGKRA